MQLISEYDKSLSAKSYLDGLTKAVFIIDHVTNICLVKLACGLPTLHACSKEIGKIDINLPTIILMS